MTSIKQTETNRRNARKPRGYHNPAGDYPAGFKFQSRYLRAAPNQYGGGVRTGHGVLDHRPGAAVGRGREACRVIRADQIDEGGMNETAANCDGMRRMDDHQPKNGIGRLRLC